MERNGFYLSATRLIIRAEFDINMVGVLSSGADACPPLIPDDIMQVDQMNLEQT